MFEKADRNRAKSSSVESSTPQPLQESTLEANTEFLCYAAFEVLEIEAECNP